MSATLVDYVKMAKLIIRLFLCDYFVEIYSICSLSFKVIQGHIRKKEERLIGSHFVAFNHTFLNSIDYGALCSVN